MSRILGIVHGCTGCPHRQYYSGGQYECAKMRVRLPENDPLPDWCPLPPHPAQAMENMRAELERLRRAQPQPEKPDAQGR